MTFDRDENQARIAELLADNAARQARRLAGEPDAAEQWAATRPQPILRRELGGDDDGLVYGRAVETRSDQSPVFTAAQTEALGMALAGIKQQVRDEAAAEMARLREEIGQLRADLTLLRAQADGTVKKMRGRDVA